MNKFIYRKTIPYTFKEVTGLADFDKVGWSIFEDDILVGGIKFHEMETNDAVAKLINCKKFLSLSAIEILPEFRSKGKGGEVVRELFSICDGIILAIQDLKAKKFWEDKMGAKMLASVSEKDGNDVHTLVYVLGKDKETTKIVFLYFMFLNKEKSIGEANDLQKNFINNKIK